MSAEQELRDLVDERMHAVCDRDSATLAARPTDDVTTFDVLPPLNSRGSQAIADHMEQWFDGYGTQDAPRGPQAIVVWDAWKCQPHFVSITLTIEA